MYVANGIKTRDRQNSWRFRSTNLIPNVLRIISIEICIHSNNFLYYFIDIPILSAVKG